MNIYRAPESELGDGKVLIIPHRFWKFFFWVSVLISALIPLMLMTIDNLNIFDYADLFVFFVGVASLYGYVFSRKLGRRVLWRTFSFIYPLWAIFYGVVIAFVLNIPQYGDPAVVDLWLVIDPLFVIPTSIAIYLYGYKSNHIWVS